MNLGNNHTEGYRVEIDDDNESFHSFTQSDRDSPDLGSFTDIDDDSIRDAPNLEFENIAIKNVSIHTHIYLRCRKNLDFLNLHHSAEAKLGF